MDVFSSSFAPCVSASNARGIAPDYLLDILLDTTFTTKKVISVDLVEVNTLFDVDLRTATLAARLIFDIAERL